MQHHGRIEPVQLFSEDASKINLSEGARLPLDKPARKRRKHRKFDKEAVSLKLDFVIQSDQIPPPSTYDIAKQLGYDASYLTKRLPEQCHKISERFRLYR